MIFGVNVDFLEKVGYYQDKKDKVGHFPKKKDSCYLSIFSSSAPE